MRKIWEKLQRNGWASVAAHNPVDPYEAFYLCVLAYNQQALEIAHKMSEVALQLDQTSQLFWEMNAFLKALRNGQRRSAYVETNGFEAFVRGGSNAPLYDILSSHLRQVYTEFAQLRLLDVGAGDGYALLPALTSHVTHVDVIEPSTVMLNKLATALDTCTQTYTLHHQSVQAFISQPDTNQPWELIQSTFALQSLPPTERREVLAWLRAHSKRLLIAEFDVPQFHDTLSPEYAAYVMERFAYGLTEYDSNSPVAQGFLMPVLFGYFDNTTTRVNYEQPIRQWGEDLKQAGFGTVTQTYLYNYWWAPAFLIDAI